MTPNIPDMPQHLLLAIDHHRQLVEDAKRYREAALVRSVVSPKGLGIRYRIGVMLIGFGLWVQGRRSDTVWG